MSAYANVLILKIKEKFDYKNNYENSSRSLDKKRLEKHFTITHVCEKSLFVRYFGTNNVLWPHSSDHANGLFPGFGIHKTKSHEDRNVC